MNFENVKDRSGAVAYVSWVLRIIPGVISKEFRNAMDLSRQYDISARDLLEFRKEQTRPK